MAMRVKGGQFVPRSAGKGASSAQRTAAAKEVAKAFYTLGNVARMGSAIGPREKAQVDNIMRMLENLEESLTYPDNDGN
jgi:hypothetical protein